MIHFSLNRRRAACLFILLFLGASVLAADPSDRLLELRSLSARAPRDVALADEIAKTLFELGRREEALRHLLGAHFTAEKAADRRRLESRVRVLARTFQKADSAKLYQAGVGALAGGRFGLAEARFTECLLGEPGHFDLLARRGQARWMQGNVDGAHEDFSQAAMLLPFEPELRLWLGISKLRRGERRQGLGHLEEAIRQGTTEQRRRPIWRAAQILVQREAGRDLTRSVSFAEWVRSGQAPSWLLEELLQADPPSQALLSLLGIAVKLKPNAKIETDGESGISLDVWQPERLQKRLAESAANPTQ